ncbi:MAG TPA: hypothetical protein VKG20_21545, partial [Methylomirabilota bacterium]|nr:hypothetical protein [Methylomirabilota bacterium]
MAIDADQETRNLTATFGSAAGEFQRFAQAMSRGPGGFNTAEIEKGVESTRALAQQFNLTQRQMEGLVEAAGKLATIRDVPLATALNALVQGLQGSSAAASALGLSLSDQQVSLRALGGQYSATFSVLSEGEKTQLRYIELLDQIDRAQIRVSASGKTDAQRAQERAKELENEINRLNTILGQGPLIGIVGALDQVSGAVTQSTDQQRQALRKSEGDYISWTQAVNQSIQRTAEAQGRIAAPFGLEPPQLLGPPPERITDTAGPQALQQVNQALAQARGAAGNLLATTDAQLATLARREAEVTSLTVDFAQKEATAVGQLTAVIRAQIETSGDPAERARLQARLDFINRTADAYDQLLVSQRQLNELQQDSTILAGREAEIRLRALPAMQEMQRVQNQIAQDQVRAQQAAAPSSRAAQDLQTAMQEQRLIAQNVFATAEQRQAAALRFRELALQQPGAELAALRAQRPVTAADRAAEDAARAARLQQLQLEQNLFPITFAEQQLAELRAIAAAVAAAKQQQVDIIIQGAIDISGNAISQISDEQAKDIVDTATAQLEARIHAARL